MKIMICLLLIPVALTAQNNPVELGDVDWQRSWEVAQRRSTRERKPVLILFQEIPGCATCRNYGSQVLTHPLVVEAIETLFVPLAIHNNKGGQDAEMLRRYNEPAWNNPVVRIVDAEGDDIVPRLSGNYTTPGLVQYMSQGLVRSEGMSPPYLSLLMDEMAAQQRGVERATYSMHCFWTGEALFGRLNGVVKTTAGFQNGREVVTVEYDPYVITRKQLDVIAGKQQCAVETGGGFRPDSTPKYYLSHSDYRFIPMTEIQKCRVNSALAEKQSPDQFLSPKQLQLLRNNTRVSCVELSLEEGWRRAITN